MISKYHAAAGKSLAPERQMTQMVRSESAPSLIQKEETAAIMATVGDKARREAKWQRSLRGRDDRRNHQLFCLPYYQDACHQSGMKSTNPR